MTKTVLFGKESREKTLLGVQKITDAVRVTMGACGKNVLIGNAVWGNDGLVQLPTLVTKDGYEVTKHFELADAVENRGAMAIKEAARKTVIEAGDSTTCTCVLAESLITNGIKLIDEGANSQQLKKGMDKSLEYVISELEKISTPIKGDIEKIRQVATVSANNDSSIGDLIAKAYSKIGDTGIIEVETGNGIETGIKISEGYTIDRGWESALFVNNPAKEICEFENPLILLYDKKIIHHTQVENAIIISNQQQRPLLIICDGLEEEGLAYLAINNFRKTIRCCVIKSPFGLSKTDDMQDLALLTGGDYVSDLRAIDIKEVEFENFGQAEKVVVSKTETTIRGGNKDNEKFDEFIADLKMNLAQEKTEEEKYPIEKRIAKLSGKVAVIQIGAATETELNEKLFRVDDSVRATRAAISEGFVAGGGTAFLRIPPLQFTFGKDTSDYDKGRLLVMDALQVPLKQICENAGINSDEIYLKVSSEIGNMGYNALTGKIEDIVESGIIDSTKALRCALINAVSVAGMVITSECSIITVS